MTLPPEPAPLPPAPAPLPPAPVPLPRSPTLEQTFQVELRKLLDRKVWTAPHGFRVAAQAWLDR